MEAFPSKFECTAATALLLLSSKPPSLSFLSPTSSSCCFMESFNSNGKSSEEDSFLGDSKSCSSSLASDGGSYQEIRTYRLRVLAVAARLHEMKLKVVRRSRSKHYRNSDRRKNLSDEWRSPVMNTPAPVKESTEALSLSSASSAVYGEPSRRLIRVGKAWLDREEKLRRVQKVGSPYMRRRAEAILKFLSVGCASETRIREVLGDSPDTSKALRMLLKLEEVKRSGTGGRRDPYLYMVVEPRSDLDSA